MAEVVFLVGFCALGSAVVVAITGWPKSYWWPVFGYVSLVTLAQFAMME